MRLIVISIGLGLVLYALSQTPHAPPALAVVGFLVITAGVVSRMLGLLAVPWAAGAIVTGLAVGSSSILPSEWLWSTSPFVEFARAWLGLALGSMVSRSLLTNRRLLLSAGTLYITPVLLAGIGLFVSSLPPLTAARLALLAGLPAPLFTVSRRHRTDESHSHSLLITALGLSLWALTGLPEGFAFTTQSVPGMCFEALVFAAGIEMGYRLLKTTRSEGNRVAALLFFALMLTLFAWMRHLNPLPISLLAGVGLSLRGAHTVGPLTAAPASMLVMALVLVDFGLDLLPIRLASASSALAFLGIYGTAMIAGKTIGGLIVRRYFSSPAQSWVPLIPQGFLAALCFSAMSPDALPKSTTAFFVILFCIALPIVVAPVEWGILKWKNGRRAARAVRQAV